MPDYRIAPRIKLPPPLVFCGVTTDERMVIGGAFQMADTIGVPLWFSLDQAAEKNFVISMPHYFASAMEHGWDDADTFGKIREALADHGNLGSLDRIKTACIAMFMEVARTMPGQSAPAIGRKMREMLEEYGYSPDGLEGSIPS